MPTGICLYFGHYNPKNYIADYVGHETEHMIDQVYGHIKANSKERFTEILNTYYSNLFGDSN